MGLAVPLAAKAKLEFLSMQNIYIVTKLMSTERESHQSVQAL